MTNIKLIRTTLALTLTTLLLAPVAQAHQGTMPATVQVQGKDYSFGSPKTLPTGWTTFEFKNDGQEPHHMQLVRLPDGMTQDTFLANLKQNEGATLAQVDMVGGVGVLMPGQSQQITLNLTDPGTYLELCFVPDAKGVPHLALGMVSAVQVTASQAASAEPPHADLKVKLQDFGFELPKGATIHEGTQVWEIENVGPEGHEMAILQIAPGKTLDDISKYVASPEGAPPFIFAGGAQAVTSGHTSYAQLNLKAGNYVLVCFLPSPTHKGMPHMALGMVRPFTVEAGSAAH
ncbi:hypothetical protein [Deinococcus sonorensis]|uniref:Blue (type 1) copper domain-containing protein n=2 Tax=Deinococcus sonorensis TaxID=309891 RepID=A0AAU7U4G5_9DEIO